MNTKNNKRWQRSRNALESAFLELLQSRELNQITVSELCQATGLNRSTFYANYADIYDLADEIRGKLEREVQDLYQQDMANKYNSHDYLRLFRHIRENQLVYKTWFKLGYDRTYEINLYDHPLAERMFQGRYIDYHIAFFMAGFNAMVRKWLDGGCRESPEEMSEILKSEYQGRWVPGEKAESLDFP